MRYMLDFLFIVSILPYIQDIEYLPVRFVIVSQNNSWGPKEQTCSIMSHYYSRMISNCDLKSYLKSC